MSDILSICAEGPLRRLTLNRPEKRNALDAALCRRLVEAIGEAAADRTVGAILLDANGKDFCSGMDLEEAATTDPDELLPLHQELFSIGERLCKPMVAAVHGGALAGGLGLALNAHLVIASRDARFGLTEVRVGLWPYLVFRAVAAAVGNRKATELALTARIVDTDEACRIGIADIVVEREELLAESRKVALGAAEGSATAIEQGLSFVRRTLGMDESAANKLAGEFRKAAHASADFKEGIRAFREKRRPRWPSRAI